MSKALQIAQEVVAAVGGKDNVTGNEICMTRLRIRTEDPSLVDAEQLTATRGVLGIVQRGAKGIEVVFGPGKVEDVHDAIVDITGVESADDVDDAQESLSPMNVIVNEKPTATAARPAGGAAKPIPAAGDDLESVKSLISLLDDAEEGHEDGVAAAAVTEQPSPAAAQDIPADNADGPALLVINGPNINMLGIREPGIYGTENYAALLALCKQSAAEAGFAKCTCYQSNHEGDLVDAIQDAYGTYDGIVINPGAYTHTSIAILDAAKAVQLPIVEVHISKVEEREAFRQVSYIRQACFETVTGLGIQGYAKAIADLAEKLGL